LQVDGAVVVDLYAGAADFQAGASWRDDTVAVVLSVTKGIAAICALMLAERGAIDLDAPIAHYWPEFGASGKSDIPLAWVLSHRAGLAAVDADLTLDDVLAWEPVVHAIAMQRPQWTPGTRHGYHPRSYGWIIGEVVRRVTGRTLGSFLADEIAAPLSSDFWIGLPAGMERRVAHRRGKHFSRPEHPLEALGRGGELAAGECKDAGRRY
jgi:CubicO group peptidase (beta-lactamase class C family)